MIGKSLVNSKIVSSCLRACLAVLIVLLISVIFYLYQQGAWREIITYYRFFINPQRLRTFISSFGPFSQVMFVLIQALQVIFAPVPGEVTGFVGGYLFGSGFGTVLSTIGLMMGSSFAFGIARAFGVRLVEKVVQRQYIEKFDFFITHKGLYITFVLFVIPGFPKDSLCYLLGLTHMRFMDFFLMNLIGRLPGTLMLTYQGSAVKNEHYLSFFAMFAASLVLILILYILREHLVEKFSVLSHRLYHHLRKLRTKERGDQ